MADAPQCKICKTAHWSTQGHSWPKGDADTAPTSDLNHVGNGVVAARSVKSPSGACAGCAARDQVIDRQRVQLESNKVELADLALQIAELQRNASVTNVTRNVTDAVTNVTPSVTKRVTRNAGVTPQRNAVTQSNAGRQRAYRERKAKLASPT